MKINNESKAQNIDLILELYETISKLETENKELRDYAIHLADCNISYDVDCDCGLSELLSKGNKE